MLMMHVLSAIGLTALTVIIHGVGTVTAVGRIAPRVAGGETRHRRLRTELLMAQLVSMLLLLHLSEAVVWALFLVLVGAFQVNPWLAACAALGIIFAAVYLLWMYQRVIFGDLTVEANRRLKDLSLREWAVILPVLLFIFWIGVHPITFTRPTEASVEALITQVHTKAGATAALADRPR